MSKKIIVFLKRNISNGNSQTLIIKSFIFYIVHLALRGGTTRSCLGLLKVFRDTGLERENGKL